MSVPTIKQISLLIVAVKHEPSVPSIITVSFTNKLIYYSVLDLDAGNLRIPNDIHSRFKYLFTIIDLTLYYTKYIKLIQFVEWVFLFLFSVLKSELASVPKKTLAWGWYRGPTTADAKNIPLHRTFLHSHLSFCFDQTNCVEWNSIS